MICIVSHTLKRLWLAAQIRRYHIMFAMFGETHACDDATSYICVYSFRASISWHYPVDQNTALWGFIWWCACMWCKVMWCNLILVCPAGIPDSRCQDDCSWGHKCEGLCGGGVKHNDKTPEVSQLIRQQIECRADIIECCDHSPIFACSVVWHMGAYICSGWFEAAVVEFTMFLHGETWNRRLDCLCCFNWFIFM